MCNCFKELEEQAMEIVEKEYPNREIKDITFNGWNLLRRPMPAGGWINTQVVLKSPSGKGVYRRNIGTKKGFAPFHLRWSYCPICGEKIRR